MPTTIKRGNLAMFLSDYALNEKTNEDIYNVMCDICKELRTSGHRTTEHKRLPNHPAILFGGCGFGFEDAIIEYVLKNYREYFAAYNYGGDDKEIHLL